MSYEEAALVPLSDELRGSLRMIAPKGCSIRYYKNLYYHAVICYICFISWSFIFFNFLFFCCINHIYQQPRLFYLLFMPSCYIKLLWIRTVHDIYLLMVLCYTFYAITKRRDQQRSMRVGGSLMTMDRRKRKTYEKPHGSKNIKWFAKYKYV